MEEDFVIDVGQRIRNSREKANMSIKALAKLSGLSPATIQKIETNHMVPTIVSLMKISRALGKRVSFFMEENETAHRVALIKRGMRKRFYSQGSKCLHEYIVGELEEGILEGGVFTAQPGGASGKRLNSHPGEELILCLEGEIEVQISDQKHRLETGDTLHFKSDIPHRWWNPGTSKSQIVWIYTQVSF